MARNVFSAAAYFIHSRPPFLHFNKISSSSSISFSSISEILPNHLPNSIRLENITKLDDPNHLRDYYEFENITKLDDALQLFDEMLQCKPSPPVRQFTHLISIVIKMNHFLPALSLLDKLCLKGVSDLHTITMSINCYCHLKKLGYGFAMLEPNVATYSTLLQGMFHFGKCSSAWDLLSKMQADGITPNLQTYSIVLDGLCKNNRIEEALSLFRSMETRGSNSEVIHYNILIHATSMIGKFDTANYLLKELCSKGLQPDVCTYNTLINGLCKQGLVEKSKEVLIKMEENGCTPNNVTYNILLQELLKLKASHEAVLLVGKTVEKSFSPNDSNLFMLIDILPAEGQDPTLINIIQKFVPKDKTS